MFDKLKDFSDRTLDSFSDVVSSMRDIDLKSVSEIFRQIAALTLAMIVALPVLADEEKDAMFGLRWGMTPAAVKTMGVLISKEGGDKKTLKHTRPHPGEMV